MHELARLGAIWARKTAARSTVARCCSNSVPD